MPVLISRMTLAYYKIHFGLDAAWTFSVTGHRKGGGGGIGAFLKATGRRATLSKGAHPSSPKDFYDFLVKGQFERAKVSGRADSPVYILFLETIQVEKIKNLVINPRIEKLSSTGSVHNLSVHFFTMKGYVGIIKEIRDMHEFEASFNKSISYWRISKSSHSITFSFQ